MKEQIKKLQEKLIGLTYKLMAIENNTKEWRELDCDAAAIRTTLETLALYGEYKYYDQNNNITDPTDVCMVSPNGFLYKRVFLDYLCREVKNKKHMMQYECENEANRLEIEIKYIESLIEYLLCQ